jgi:integrase
MLRWAICSDRHSAKYRCDRLSIVRCFARHLVGRDGRSEVPDTRLLAVGNRRLQPHIYTERQLCQLVKTAALIPRFYPLRAETVSTVVGLLGSTGLRVSEALNLHRADVDLRAGLLHIRESKFRKSRLVPMHPSVNRALKRYARRRDGEPATKAAVLFFVGRDGRRFPYPTFLVIFRDLCRQIGVRPSGDRLVPRPMDLRHTFASRRLLQWYRDGVDVHQAMASLSTYLGH